MSVFRGVRRALYASGVTPFAGAYDDISNIVHIYEIARRTLTSYEGSLVRLRRASDNGESDFGYDSDGNLDTVAIAAWAGGASYVVTVYDQVSGDDITQATAAKQPLFTASAQNGHAGMLFDGTSHSLAGAFTTGGITSQPFNIYVVSQLDVSVVDDDSSRTAFDGNDSTNRAVLSKADRAPNDEWYIYAGVALYCGATDANWKVFSNLFNGASSQLWANGASLASGNAGIKNIDGLTLGAAFNASGPWKGYITSIFVADPSHTTAQRQAAETAINNYWAVY